MIDQFGQLFEAVAAHGPFLLFALPLVGALLVRPSARFGDETVRRTAVSNVLLSIAVAVNLLIQLECESPADVQPGDPFRIQMSGEMQFETAPAADTASRTESGRRGDVSIQATADAPGSPVLLRIAVGVDGLNVWFLLLIPLAMLPATLSAGCGANPARRLTALLILESSLIGAFAAVDGVFILVCLELSALLMVLTVGCWCEPKNRRAIGQLALTQLAGVLLIGLALAGSVIGHQWLTAGEFSRHHPPTFSVVEITSDLPPASDDFEVSTGYWATLEPFLFAMFIVGCGLLSAVFPFHRRLCGDGELPPAFVSIPLYAVAPCLGVYAFLRFTAAICPASAAVNAGLLSTFSLSGGVYCAWIAATRQRFGEVVKYGCVAHVAVAFGAAVSLRGDGLASAMFQLISHIAGFSLLCVIAEDVEFTTKNSALLRTGVVAAAIGLPGLAGFVGLWTAVTGFLAAGSPWLATTAIVVCVLIARGLVAADAPARRRDNRPSAFVSALPLVLVLLAFGVAPQFVVDRSASAVRRLERGALAGAGRTAAAQGSSLAPPYEAWDLLRTVVTTDDRAVASGEAGCD